LGILTTENDKITLHYFLRSNKTSSLIFLEERLQVFYKMLGCKTLAFGHTPPWEYKEDSALKELYKECFKKVFLKEAKIEAIHAGLECAVFTSKIEGIDCISLGPDIFDAHTPKERLSVESTEKVYTLLLEMLKNLK
jgi:dipeptidase D